MMTHHFSLTAIAWIFLTAVFSAAIPSTGSSVHGQDKVSVSAAVAKVADHDDLLEVTVTFEILPNWHIYAQLPKDHPSVLTSVKFAVPEGIGEEGKLVLPKSVADPAEPGVFYFKGKSIFRQRFKLAPGAKFDEEDAIEVQVRYQACTKTMCQPPASKKIQLEIPKE
jgi:hypothetical protein